MSEIEEHEGTENQEKAPVSRAELDKVFLENQELKGEVQALKDELDALKAKMGDTSKAAEQSEHPQIKYAKAPKLVVDERFDVRA
jgi:molecular chaperone GrpE (heat shock protein)